MFELMVRSGFSAAHRLRNYRGSCASLHGHNWNVELKLRSGFLGKNGMVMDARGIKKILRDFLKKNLDHAFLNRLAFFRKNNPTSENIAKFIYKGLKKSLPILEEVCVSESDSVTVRYVNEKSSRSLIRRR